MVAEGRGSEPRDGEARIEFESCMGRFARFLDLVEAGQQRPQGANAATMNSARSRWRGSPSERPPRRGLRSPWPAPRLSSSRAPDVAGTDPQRFEDVPFGLLVAPSNILSNADDCVGPGPVTVDRQRALAFGDALRNPFAQNAQISERRAGPRRGPNSISKLCSGPHQPSEVALRGRPTTTCRRQADRSSPDRSAPSTLFGSRSRARSKWRRAFRRLSGVGPLLHWASPRKK